jgi:hypothetical protein
MQLLKAFPDRRYPVDSVVSVMLLRSDYKVLGKALEVYKDQLLSVKARSDTQEWELEGIRDILCEMANNIGPALFQEGE